jgi:hypothetical protein
MLTMMARKLHSKWAKRQRWLPKEENGLAKDQGGEDEHKEISDG